MLIKVYFDAARQPTNKHSSAGCVQVMAGQQVQLKTRLANTADNHQAEFLAAIWAIESLPTLPGASLQLYSDSQLVVDALQKNYAKHYQIYVDRLTQLLAPYSLVLINWVAEKDNQGAHQLALQALQSK